MPAVTTLPRALATLATTCALLTTLTASADAAFAPVFGGHTAVSTENSTAGWPRIAATDNRVVTAWEQSDGSNTVVMAASLDGGGTWSSPETISATGEDVTGQELRLVADRGGNVTAVWRVANTWDVKTRTLLSGGHEWSPIVTLDSTSTSNLELAARPDGSVACAWGTTSSGPHTVRIRTRSADSADWSDPVDLDQGSDWTDAIDLAFNASGDGIVSWNSGPPGSGTHEARAARYDHDSGWGTPVTLPGSDLGTWEQASNAITPQGDVTVLWIDPTYGVWTASAPAGGLAFSAPEQLSAPGTGGNLPELASDRDGNIVALFGQLVYNPDPIVMYTSIRAITRTRDADSGEWGSPSQAVGNQFGGGSMLLASPNYDIAGVLFYGDDLDLSRLGEGAVPAHIGFLARPDGSGALALSSIATGFQSVSNGTPVLAMNAAGDAFAVWNAAGDGSARAITVAIGDGSGPVLDAVTVPGSGVAGQEVAVSAEADDVWSDVASVSWNFGDGTTTTGSSASHSYGAAGTHTVTVTATDTAGNTTTATRRITVSDPPAPPADDATDPPVLLPPVLEARLSGKTITLNARVTLRDGKRCTGTITATATFGGRTYKLAAQLARAGGTCRAQGTIKLRKSPGLRTRLRVTLTSRSIRTRTVTTRR